MVMGFFIQSLWKTFFEVDDFKDAKVWNRIYGCIGTPKALFYGFMCKCFKNLRMGKTPREMRRPIRFHDVNYCILNTVAVHLNFMI